VTLDQVVRRGTTRLFTATVLVVLVSLGGKPLRLSRGLRAAFDANEGPR
jgi:acyl-CoA thioesterase FadM